MTRNIYQELQEKINDSKLDQKEKLVQSMNLFSIAMAEKESNDKHQSDFEKMKQLCTDHFKKEFENLDITKLKLFQQATGNYRPSMCDSSMFGTTNQHYLSQIDTLFTDETYRISDPNDGEISPILWNINDQSNDYCIEFTEDSEKWTKRLLNFGKTHIRAEGFYGEGPICNLPWFRTMDPFFKWIREVLGKEVEVIRHDNTYNYDGLFVMQFYVFRVDDKVYIELEIHIGADVRGGYSPPIIYECDEEGYATILSSNEDIGFYCPECHEDSQMYYKPEKREWNKEQKQWICKNEIKIEKKNGNGKTHRQQTLNNGSIDDTKICNGELRVLFN